MGQITVETNYDGDYWKDLMYRVTGKLPTIKAIRSYRVTLSCDDSLLTQDTLDALVAVRNRNVARVKPVETG